MDRHKIFEMEGLKRMFQSVGWIENLDLQPEKHLTPF